MIFNFCMVSFGRDSPTNGLGTSLPQRQLTLSSLRTEWVGAKIQLYSERTKEIW